MPDRIVLDHVAHAADSHDLLLPRYAGDLGARYRGHGEGFGFSPMQIGFANGATLELLRPHQEDRNPFLRRFLDKRGPGLHHATFKVPDIRATMATLDAAGFPLVDVNLEWEDWQEAFVHPKAAFGFLVQIAQATSHMPAASPPGYPDAARRAALVRLALAVASIDAGLVLYRDLLSGRVVDEGDAGDGRWVDIDHDGKQVVRLWQPDDASVLGEAAGRADHLAFRVDDPSVIAGAERTSDGGWHVPAAANHGARLVLQGD